MVGRACAYVDKVIRTSKPYWEPRTPIGIHPFTLSRAQDCTSGVERGRPMLSQSARWPRRAGIGLIVGGVMAASVVLTSTIAGAKSTPASGAITCSTVSGTVKFKPGLTNTARTVKMRVSLKLPDSGCILVITSSMTVKSVAPKVNTTKSNSFKLVGGDCGTLSGTSAVANSKWTTRWIGPPGTRPSKVRFIGFDAGTNADGTVLSFPKVSDSASGSGSYPGNDDFASSTQQLNSTMTSSQITTACGSSKGLTTLTISSGTIHIG